MFKSYVFLQLHAAHMGSVNVIHEISVCRWFSMCKTGLIIHMNEITFLLTVKFTFFTIWQDPYKMCEPMYYWKVLAYMWSYS